MSQGALTPPSDVERQAPPQRRNPRTNHQTNIVHSRGTDRPSNPHQPSLITHHSSTVAPTSSIHCLAISTLPPTGSSPGGRHIAPTSSLPPTHERHPKPIRTNPHRHPLIGTRAPDRYSRHTEPVHPHGCRATPTPRHYDHATNTHSPSLAPKQRKTQAESACPLPHTLLRRPHPLPSLRPRPQAPRYSDTQWHREIPRHRRYAHKETRPRRGPKHTQNKAPQPQINAARAPNPRTRMPIGISAQPKEKCVL